MMNLEIFAESHPCSPRFSKVSAKDWLSALVLLSKFMVTEAFISHKAAPMKTRMRTKMWWWNIRSQPGKFRSFWEGNECGTGVWSGEWSSPVHWMCYINSYKFWWQTWAFRKGSKLVLNGRMRGGHLKVAWFFDARAPLMQSLDLRHQRIVPQDSFCRAGPKVRKLWNPPDISCNYWFTHNLKQSHTPSISI